MQDTHIKAVPSTQQVLRKYLWNKSLMHFLKQISLHYHAKEALSKNYRFLNIKKYSNDVWHIYWRGQGTKSSGECSFISVLFVAQNVNFNYLFQTPPSISVNLNSNIIRKVPSFPQGSHPFHFLFQKESLLDQMSFYNFLWFFKTSYKTSFFWVPRPEIILYTEFYFHFQVILLLLVGHNIWVSYTHFRSPKPM